MKIENPEIRTNPFKKSPARKKDGLHQVKIRVFIGSTDYGKFRNNVSDLIDKSDLSIRRISGITRHSINTVRKIKQLKQS